MATKTFISRAAIRTQVDLITLTGTVNAGDIVTATINTRAEAYTLTATDTTLALAAASAAAFFGQSNNPEFQEAGWSSSGDAVTATSNDTGRPFTLTSGGTGITATQSTSVTNSSPQDVSIAANWNGAALPTTGDDLVFENSSGGAIYGLSTTFDPATVTVRETFNGPIGLPEIASGDYPEYRGTYFQCTAAATLVIEQSQSAGPGHYKFSFTSDVVTATISSTAGGAVQKDQEVVWLKGTAANSVVNVYGGSVVLAPVTGDVATVTTVRVIDGSFRATSGVTFSSATIAQEGGSVDISTNVGTWTIDGAGAVGIVRGTATITTLSIDNGTVTFLSTGTITTLNVGSGGVADFSEVLGAITVTNCVVTEGATIRDPHRRVTFTNGIKLTRCELMDDRGSPKVTLILGTHLTVTPSAY
jgi:hypothetical protein